MRLRFEDFGSEPKIWWLIFRQLYLEQFENEAHAAKGI